MAGESRDRDRLLIVGNGIAGTTVAREVRKRSDRPITILSGESDHFFSRTALMYIYMGHMQYQHTKPYEDHFWSKNRIDLVRGWVEQIDCQARCVQLASGESLAFGELVIASGSKPNRFGWPGQDLEGVQGLYSLQDLELLERNTRQHQVQRAVIVGGGLIGIELAEMLVVEGIAVTFLVREKRYWGSVLPKEEAELVGRHVREHHVDLRLSTELDSILDDGQGRVRAVVTKDGEEIPCQLVGLTAGVGPNIEFVRSSQVACGRGVLVDEQQRTNIAGVYACGDCAEIATPEGEPNRVESLWYTGRLQGEALARVLCGDELPYCRGTWFNSAKFFDIEYQTYGRAPPELPEGATSFYWEHPDGTKCLRLVYADDEGQALLGVNAFGIRYRQVVFQRFIEEATPVTEVLERLGEANFDPEFFVQHEAAMVQAFNAQHPDAGLQLRSRRGLKSLLQFRWGQRPAEGRG